MRLDTLAGAVNEQLLLSLFASCALVVPRGADLSAAALKVKLPRAAPAASHAALIRQQREGERKK